MMIDLETRVAKLERDLAGFGSPKPMVPGPCRRLAEAAAAIHGVPLHTVLSMRCARKYARPRMQAMHLAVRLTGLSLPMIGRAFDRDHTTVLHAHRAMGALAAVNPDFASQLDAIARVAGFSVEFVRPDNSMKGATP